ncbi:MAG: hypothetical protein ACOYUZ_02710 [Patescibacteria group bacterium]
MTWLIYAIIALTALIVYLMIGVSISFTSWYIACCFERMRKQHPITCFLLFPYSSYVKQYYSTINEYTSNRADKWTMPEASGFPLDLAIIIFWPFKLVYNLLFLIVYGFLIRIVLKAIFVTILWNLIKAIAGAGMLLVALARDKEIRQLASKRRNLAKLPPEQCLRALQEDRMRVEEAQRNLEAQMEEVAKRHRIDLGPYREEQNKKDSDADTSTVIPMPRRTIRL